MNEFSGYSAVELAALVRAKDVSSRELVEAHIASLERVNPKLNAVVATRFDAARAEAEAADRALAAGEATGPFHGVPCTIKEAFALEGMPNASGLVARRDYRSPDDATTVRRIRDAGAIPLGVTNTSELCMWMESNNRLYGRTNNPYDPSRTVGGSSGGEGAMVGAGVSPFGLGSDVGGSIRMPAFFNGVFGHKPTGTLIPNSGQFPTTEGIALRYLTTGPLTRRAGDLWPLVQLLAGPDGLDTACSHAPLGDPRAVSLKGMKVLSVETNHIRKPSADLVDAQRRAARALEARGAHVEVVEIPEFRHSIDYWSAMLGSSEGPGFAEMLGTPRFVDVAGQFARYAVGRSPHTLPALMLAALEKPMGGGRKRAEQLIARGERFRDDLAARLGDNGVMLFPSHSLPAPRHGLPQLRLIDWVYTAIFNVLEFPVTQVPLGLNAAGLPLGVQVVGNHFRDHVTVAVAQALEEDLGGWVPPAGLRA